MQKFKDGANLAKTFLVLWIMFALLTYGMSVGFGYIQQPWGG